MARQKSLRTRWRELKRAFKERGKVVTNYREYSPSGALYTLGGVDCETVINKERDTYITLFPGFEPKGFRAEDIAPGVHVDAVCKTAREVAKQMLEDAADAHAATMKAIGFSK